MVTWSQTPDKNLSDFGNMEIISLKGSDFDHAMTYNVLIFIALHKLH